MGLPIGGALERGGVSVSWVIWPISSGFIPEVLLKIKNSWRTDSSVKYSERPGALTYGERGQGDTEGCCQTPH